MLIYLSGLLYVKVDDLCYIKFNHRVKKTVIFHSS
ncbi:Uncharacterised protein [Porphyromonas cangingivalis]|nr:Uncharacterised protein [Porphyromonas cangingivalis]